MTQIRISRSAVYAVTAMILLITLFFGLKPKGFRFYNQVRWLQDRNGISYFNTGMAYSEKTLREIGISDSLSIAVALKPYRTGRRLSEVISIIDDEGNSLLGIEQWMDGLMATLWERTEERIGKIGIGNSLSVDSPRFAVIIINPSEMKLIIADSGVMTERRKIRLPHNHFGNGRMLLGLAANGRNAWRGEMGGLALFARELSNQETGAFARRWRETGSFETISQGKPAALFLFNARQGKTIADQSGHRWDFHIPPYPRMFKYEVLTFLPNTSRIDRSYIEDMIVNLLGFIPLGGCLYLLFLHLLHSNKKSVVFTVCCALLISLCIELVQVFIPTRTSQITDVILNGAGAWAGAVLARIGLRLINGPLGDLEKKS